MGVGPKRPTFFVKPISQKALKFAFLKGKRDDKYKMNRYGIN